MMFNFWRGYLETAPSAGVTLYTAAWSKKRWVQMDLNDAHDATDSHRGDPSAMTAPRHSDAKRCWLKFGRKLNSRTTLDEQDPKWLREQGGKSRTTTN